MSSPDINPLAEFSDEVRVYDPLVYLIGQAALTGIADVYLNAAPELNPEKEIVVFTTGPSGSGKDTLIEPLVASGLLRQAKTATTRRRRTKEIEGVDEPIDAYVWMRERRSDETEDTYHAHLVEEYLLIESTPRNGHLYGLPLQSINDASKHGAVLIRLGTEGIRSLRGALDAYNQVVISVVPESFRQIWDRIQGRGDERERFIEGIEVIKESKYLAHYLLLNRESAISSSQESLARLIEALKSRAVI